MFIFIKSIIYSTIFSFIEYFWHKVTIEDEYGNVKFKPFDKNCRKGHTSFDQWWVNIVCIPLILNIHYLIKKFLCSNVVEILFLPFMIWMLEIIEGIILKSMYGKNTAWVYHGKNVYFGGDIKITLDMYLRWLCLCLLYYFFDSF